MTTVAAHSALRRSWAERMLRLASGPVPSYGSAAWHRLAETDPTRVAGVVIAAEAWARHAEQLEDTLRLEVSASHAAHQEAEAERFAVTAADVRRHASLPSFAELCERRGEHDRAQRSRVFASLMRERWDG